MSSTSSSVRSQAVLVASLIVAAAVFRVLRAAYLPELPNFSPVMAIAFCGGLFIPGVLAWLVPLATLFLSDLALALLLGYPLAGAAQAGGWLCLIAGVGAGRWLAGRPAAGMGSFLALLVGNALLFYLVTNSLCWVMERAYPRGFAGWLQSVTLGLPGFPPAWTFFRNALFSDLIFAGLILAVRWAAFRQPLVPVRVRS